MGIKKMTIKIKQIDNYRWEVAKSGAMRVPGMVYATEAMLKSSDPQGPLK